MERTKIENVVCTTHRVLLSLIFLVAVLGHVFNTDKIVHALILVKFVNQLEAML